MTSTIDALRTELMTGRKADPAYATKMLHAVPDAPVVDRVAFILERCKGKRVLEFGASGPMHEGIVKVAAHVVGVDRHDSDGVIGFDLDAVELALPDSVMNQNGELGPDLIVCGEVLEHLSNPGWFLTRLRQQYAGVPVLITVPNAFSEISRKSIARGIEQVNKEHVCWYSMKTLDTLLRRHGFVPAEVFWYHGQPRTAEGLIMVTESM